MVEEWRSVRIDPRYDVSNFGRVRSYCYGPIPRLRKLSKNRKGYLVCTFSQRSLRTVHRLVADAFIGPCPAGQEVRHKDDNPSNARADNLEYGTRSDNHQDCIKRGRDCPVRGEKNHFAVYTDTQIARLKNLVGALPRSGKSQRLARGTIDALVLETGVSRSTVRCVLLGARWRHV